MFASPVNRIRITGNWASRSLITAHQLGFKQRLRELANYLVFQSIMLTIDAVFWWTKVRRWALHLFGRKGESFEDELERTEVYPIIHMIRAVSILFSSPSRFSTFSRTLRSVISVTITTSDDRVDKTNLSISLVCVSYRQACSERLISTIDTPLSYDAIRVISAHT